MKMKKLLSIGAIALVLACSTSTGASAATSKFPSKTELLIDIVAQQYKTGKNQTGLLSGVSKDTQIGTIVSDEFVKEVDKEYGSHVTVDKAITKYNNNKEKTVEEILVKAIDPNNFSRFKADFIDVATKLKNIDQKTGTDRENSEIKFINLVKAYDDDLRVTFGKDGKGKTTATLKNSEKIVVQLNADDLQTIINEVNNITYTDILEKAAKIKGTN